MVRSQLLPTRAEAVVSTKCTTSPDEKADKSGASCANGAVSVVLARIPLSTLYFALLALHSCSLPCTLPFTPCVLSLVSFLEVFSCTSLVLSLVLSLLLFLAAISYILTCNLPCTLPRTIPCRVLYKSHFQSSLLSSFTRPVPSVVTISYHCHLV